MASLNMNKLLIIIASLLILVSELVKIFTIILFAYIIITEKLKVIMLVFPFIALMFINISFCIWLINKSKMKLIENRK